MYLLLPATDNREWDSCLTEAAIFQLPYKVRFLFASILFFCFLADPTQLWMTRKDAILVE